LTPPYGGTLVDLLAVGDEARDLRGQASAMPSLRLTDRARLDLELLAVGAFSPVAGFLGKADYERVLGEMRLADGTLWPIPITLPVPMGDRVRDGRRYALRTTKHELMAVLDVTEVYDWDLDREARAVLGRCDLRHPLVAEMSGWSRRYVAGPLRVMALPAYYDFADLRLTPIQARRRLEALGRTEVVAFQTRNPMHRSHEELTRRAAAQRDATLFIHPAVGLTRPGDVELSTRVRSYRALVERHYDAARTLLALIPLAMRLAGPREAVWHAIIRRNYGANHFIVGRDHAGPGLDSTGRPFFEPDAAQRLLAIHELEIGVKMLRFGEMVYVPAADRYEEVNRVAPGVETISLSGTQVRRLLERGEELPGWFTRPETARLLAEAYPPRHGQGFCVWLTGLPAAGKSATAEAVTALLMERGRRVTLLDGDVVRTHLSADLGFSRDDRDTNVRRIGFVAAEVVRHGGVAVCAAVSPYREARDECRILVGGDRFFEAFVDTPLAVCAERDTKGLYARARRGEIKGFTGVDDPYEEPQHPEIRIDGMASVGTNAARIVALLTERGFLRHA
jgi:sulfate adenylyltransferase